ncbi:MAG: pilus assembly protein TadG-related protein [Robiginitomaculum sp.]|nr:pilus assembly protein TadG-related protein [Robiginitomaculum sp.]
MGLKNNIGQLAQKYRVDVQGQFAVISALIGLPLLLVGAAAVDINRVHSQNSGVGAAIDAAALAAVIPDNMSKAERYAYAQSVFDRNYIGRDAVSLDISGGRERVDIVATSQVPTTISGILGIDYINVVEETAAVLTRSDTVCVLALDPSGERAIEFSDRAAFNAPACSVQVNSTSPFAMVSGVVTPPKAKSFCVVGIAQGDYNPYVKNACTPIADPYANLPVPVDGACVEVSTLRRVTGMGRGMGIAMGRGLGLGRGVGTEDIIEDNTVMRPGTYCNGLDIRGRNVTFPPGTYIVKGGKFRVREQSEVDGQDVTFVLKGEGASLSIESDSQLSLKAPMTGTYAGLVFYQIPENPAVGRKPDFPTDTSTITSGGGLSIVGTAYFPSQELSISSDSPVASQSPATSFIAYRLKFSGRSNTQVRVDHETGGIPPLLPRSDDGARLVK